MKWFLILGIVLLSFFVLPSQVQAANVSFNITANSGSGVYGGYGNFSTPSITVDQGDNVTITFSVPSGDPYCCGLQVRGHGGQFDTGTINKGSSKQINFTATSTFNFSSYWPNTSTLKATGTVNVNSAPTPTPTPPAAPTSVNAQGVSTSQIEISWSTVTGANKYQLYRGNTQIATTNNLSYSDSNLDPNTSYSYRVKACFNTQCSGFSVTANAKTLALQGTATPTPTSTVSVTPTPSSNGGETEVPTGNGNPGSIFIDTKYDYITLENVAYDFGSIPTIDKGEEFYIYGRTEANSKITVTVKSGNELIYIATADAEGYWNVKVNTSSLRGGPHSFQTKIESNSRTYLAKGVSFNVTEKVVINQMDNSPQPSNNPLLVVFIGLGFLGVVLVITLVILRKKRTTHKSPNSPQTTQR